MTLGMVIASIHNREPTEGWPNKPWLPLGQLTGPGFVMERQFKCGSRLNRGRFVSFAPSISQLLFVVLVAGLTSNCDVLKKEPITGQLAIPTSSPSPKSEQVFVEKSHTNARGETMPYFLFVPEGSDKSKSYPLRALVAWWWQSWQRSKVATRSR